MTLLHPPALRTRTTFDLGGAVVSVSGELDVSTADELAHTLAEIADRHPRAVIVDLAGLDFIDSSGLTVLVRARQQLDAQGGTLWLSSPTPSVLRVLEIVGLDILLLA